MAQGFGLAAACRERAADKKPAADSQHQASEAPGGPAPGSGPSTPPEVLYLPSLPGSDSRSGDDQGGSLLVLPGPNSSFGSESAWSQERASRRCPEEMVDVRGEFCIDRYEGSLVSLAKRSPLSPFYPPNPELVPGLFEQAQRFRSMAQTEAGKRATVPEPPPWMLRSDLEIMVVSRKGVLPSGYLSGKLAEQACVRAKKRLCTQEEWITACRGDRQTKYPYGPVYRAGMCNVSRNSHPAQVLHGSASVNHLDPRLHLVEDVEGPLLRRTGESPACRSDFGDDAIFDMVGNLDEWVAGSPARFLGGFYSRATKEGCDASVSSHGFDYFDYSLGVRCCL